MRNIKKRGMGIVKKGLVFCMIGMMAVGATACGDKSAKRGAEQQTQGTESGKKVNNNKATLTSPKEEKKNNAQDQKSTENGQKSGGSKDDGKAGAADSTKK